MTTLTPYLLFDGNCHEAMEFYQSCFGGELMMMKVKDSPAKDRMPEFQLEKTVNARLKSGSWRSLLQTGSCPTILESPATRFAFT